MKKKLLLSGLIISSSLALTSGTWADSSSTQTRSLPPEWSTLTESDLTTLESLTGSARDEYLASKGITRPTNSGSLDHTRSRLELTDAEKTALESMTETERQAFFASKGVTPRTTGSGQPVRRELGTQKTQVGTAVSSETQISSGATTDRAARIAANQSKLLSTRIAKLQSKVRNGESLTRLEKVFARKNNIEISE